MCIAGLTVYPKKAILFWQFYVYTAAAQLYRKHNTFQEIGSFWRLRLDGCAG